VPFKCIWSHSVCIYICCQSRKAGLGAS
jgi:hypothetical protein